jgi:perosamine synthetase
MLECIIIIKGGIIMANLAVFGGKPVVPKGLEKPWPPITQEDIDAVVSVLKRGVLWGPTEVEVTGLQEEFAEYIGAKHALVVNSGTAALHACISACGVKPGDEVITTTFSFWATAQAILAQNAIPIFVDIDPETLNINPDLIEEKITEKTKAILPAHIHGIPAEMDKINAIAKKYNLKVIEDACQAAGAKYKGKMAGTLGDMAAFSLNGTKNLPAGEGGIVTTDDDELIYRARMMAMFGEKHLKKGEYRMYDAVIMGFNYRNNEMSDAFCRSFLRRYDSLQEIRYRNVEYLNRELSKLKGVKPLIPPAHVQSAYHLYKVMFYPEELGITSIHPLRFKWAMEKALCEEGATCYTWHIMPIPGERIFINKDAYGNGTPWSFDCVSEQSRNIVYDPYDYPVAIDMFDRSMIIKPIYAPNGLELMEYIVEAFKKVLNNLDEQIGRFIYV